jgi:hypothetical protein
MGDPVDLAPWPILGDPRRAADPIRAGPIRSDPGRSADPPIRSSPILGDPRRSGPILGDPIRSADPIRRAVHDPTIG